MVKMSPRLDLSEGVRIGKMPARGRYMHAGGIPVPPELLEKRRDIANMYGLQAGGGGGLSKPQKQGGGGLSKPQKQAGGSPFGAMLKSALVPLILMLALNQLSYHFKVPKRAMRGGSHLKRMRKADLVSLANLIDGPINLRGPYAKTLKGKGAGKVRGGGDSKRRGRALFILKEMMMGRGQSGGGCSCDKGKPNKRLDEILKDVLHGGASSYVNQQTAVGCIQPDWCPHCF